MPRPAPRSRGTASSRLARRLRLASHVTLSRSIRYFGQVLCCAVRHTARAPTTMRRRQLPRVPNKRGGEKEQGRPHTIRTPHTQITISKLRFARSHDTRRHERRCTCQTRSEPTTCDEAYGGRLRRGRIQAEGNRAPSHGAAPRRLSCRRRRTITRDDSELQAPSECVPVSLSHSTSASASPARRHRASDRCCCSALGGPLTTDELGWCRARHSRQ